MVPAPPSRWGRGTFFMAKANKPTEKWRARVDAAVQVQQQYNEEYGYDRALEEYRGNYAQAMPVVLRDKKIVPINEVKAYCKTLMPAIYSRDPYIAVNPRGAKNALPARVQERSVNGFWREFNLKHEVKRCIVDALLSPFGWMKVGYSAEFGKYEDKPGDPNLHPSEFIRSEEIFCVRESYKRIVYDPDSINPPYDCRWMAHKLVVPLEAVKNSPVYTNTADLKASFVGRYPGDDKKPNKILDKFQDEQEFSILWEIWDRDGAVVLTLPDNGEKFIGEKDWPKKLLEYPFVGLSFDINPDANYPQNAISIWEPQLWEKIHLRSMQIDHLKRFGRQLAAQKGSLDKGEVAKLIKGSPGIIYFNQAKGAPTPLQYPPIQPDLYLVAGAVDVDKDNLSGQGNVVRGAAQRTQSRTLGELDKLMMASQNRNTEPQDLVEDFCARIARLIISNQKAHSSIAKLIDFSQEKDEKVLAAFRDRIDEKGFLKFTKGDIQGDTDISVKCGSTLPLNKENRLQTMTAAIKLGPSIGIQPNGKTSKVLGRKIMEDLEMDEVTQAYNEEIAEIDAQMQAQAQIAQANAQGAQAGIPLPKGAGVAPGAPAGGGGGALPRV